jgi:hypothetical protein
VVGSGINDYLKVPKIESDYSFLINFRYLVWDCLDMDGSLMMVKVFRFAFLVYSLPGFHTDLV